MARYTRLIVVGVAMCALLIATSSSRAGTIIKLSLGGDSAADIEFTGGAGGLLGTADDSVPGTAGEQNTAVEYVDFLEALETDIDTPTASFTLDGLTAVGPATILGGTLVFQSFSGGTLALYDPANALLLSATLDDSALSGTLGPPGAGALFTTTNATVTGGTLAPYIDANSLTLSVALVDINGGAGFSVSPLPPPLPPPPPPGIAFGVLDAFTADASLNIAGEFVPEPASLALCLIGATLSVLPVQRRRR